jgi:putative tricarboxylic transport membrane protein
VNDAKPQGFIRSPQDFFSGLVLIAFAALVLWLTRDLPGMQGANFGPATAPRLLATALLLVGAIIVAGGVLVDGPRLERWEVRGPVLLIASIIFFAATVRTLGLAVSSFGTVIIASAATKEVRWMESVLWSAILTAAAVGVFYYGLKLPFKPWPW